MTTNHDRLIQWARDHQTSRARLRRNGRLALFTLAVLVSLALAWALYQGAVST